MLIYGGNALLLTLLFFKCHDGVEKSLKNIEELCMYKKEHFRNLQQSLTFDGDRILRQWGPRNPPIEGSRSPVIIVIDNKFVVRGANHLTIETLTVKQNFSSEQIEADAFNKGMARRLLL